MIVDWAMGIPHLGIGDVGDGPEFLIINNKRRDISIAVLLIQKSDML